LTLEYDLFNLGVEFADTIVEQALTSIARLAEGDNFNDVDRDWRKNFAEEKFIAKLRHRVKLHNSAVSTKWQWTGSYGIPLPNRTAKGYWTYHTSAQIEESVFRMGVALRGYFSTAEGRQNRTVVIAYEGGEDQLEAARAVANLISMEGITVILDEKNQMSAAELKQNMKKPGFKGKGIGIYIGKTGQVSADDMGMTFIGGTGDEMERDSVRAMEEKGMKVMNDRALMKLCEGMIKRQPAGRAPVVIGYAEGEKGRAQLMASLFAANGVRAEISGTSVRSISSRIKNIEEARSYGIYLGKEGLLVLNDRGISLDDASMNHIEQEAVRALDAGRADYDEALAKGMIDEIDASAAGLAALEGIEEYLDKKALDETLFVFDLRNFGAGSGQELRNELSAMGLGSRVKFLTDRDGDISLDSVVKSLSKGKDRRVLGVELFGDDKMAVMDYKGRTLEPYVLEYMINNHLSQGAARKYGTGEGEVIFSGAFSSPLLNDLVAKDRVLKTESARLDIDTADFRAGRWTGSLAALLVAGSIIGKDTDLLEKYKSIHRAAGVRSGQSAISLDKTRLINWRGVLRKRGGLFREGLAREVDELTGLNVTYFENGVLLEKDGDKVILYEVYDSRLNNYGLSKIMHSRTDSKIGRLADKWVNWNISPDSLSLPDRIKATAMLSLPALIFAGLLAIPVLAFGTGFLMPVVLFAVNFVVIKLSFARMVVRAFSNMGFFMSLPIAFMSGAILRGLLFGAFFRNKLEKIADRQMPEAARYPLHPKLASESIYDMEITEFGEDVKLEHGFVRIDDHGDVYL
ncbi:MAG TPA: hypothetical protein VJC03_08740, partial [bacterium]|nr:hypothetical protein [bacterium]